MKAILLLVGLLGVGLSVSALEAQTPPAQTAAAPVVRAGDAVRIMVWGNEDNPDLSGEFNIAEDGTIIHPVYRTVRIAGLAPADAEAQVRRILQRFTTNPEFVIEPLFRIAVVGQVQSPNVYTAPAYTTIPQAVSLAGGPNEVANVRRARLIRNGAVTYIDLTRPYAELEQVRVRSGDQIVLDRTNNFFRDQFRPVLTAVGAAASVVLVFLRISERA